MKNSKMTQFLSCATMFAVMVGLTGCGDNNNSSNSTSTSQTAEQLIQNSYSGETIDMSVEFYGVNNFVYSEVDDVYYFYGYDSNYNSNIYVISSDFSEITQVDLGIDESTSYLASINALSDGGVAVFCGRVSYGDLPPIDYDTIDWDTFDFTPYDEARETFYTYSIFDKNGQQQNQIKIEYDDSNDTYISGLYGFSDGSSILASDSQGLYFFDTDGKQTDKVDVSDMSWVDFISVDSDDNILVGGYGTSNYAVSKFDISSKSVTETYELNEYISSSSGIIKGTGDYSFFALTNSSLMGYNKNTNEFDEIVNWVDSDISNPCAVAVTPDMQITLIEESSDYSGNVTFSNLTKRDASELANQQVITVGMLYTDTTYTSKIAEFNKKNSGYRIKLVDYSKYDTEDNEYTGASQQLNNDLITGNAPDIIISYSGNLNMNSLISKGAFADLYEFIDNDEDLNRDSFVQNVLKINENDGKLYSIGSAFSISSLYGKTEYVGEKTNWTLDELISAYENSPEDMQFMINCYKSQMFYICFTANLDDKIDYNTKTFNYDKDELVKLLEFVNTFEDEPDWDDDAVVLEYQNSWDDYNTAMINNKYLIRNDGIYDFRNYHETLAGVFGGEPITFVGYPSDDNSGTKIAWSGAVMSIVSNSDCKEGAWSFIKEFLCDEYQMPDENGNNNVWAFPINQKAFDALAEQCKSPYFWIDSETGEKVEYETKYWFGDESVAIGDITDEELADLKDIINSATSISSYYNQDIYSICEEEAEAFFNGDKTAEETADIMLNRISIYIAEKG